MDEVHPLFAERLDRLGLLTDELVRRVAEAGHARVKGVPAELARLFVTAHEVAPCHHVAIQAAFQEHVDNSGYTSNRTRVGFIASSRRVQFYRSKTDRQQQ